MTGNQKYAVHAQILNSGTVFILFVILIPRLGILGAAISIAMGLFLSNAYNLYFVYRKFHFIPYTKDYLKLSLPVMVSGLLLLLLKSPIQGNFNYTLQAIMGLLLAYMAFLPLTWVWGLNTTDRIIINRLKKKFGLIK
jgi:O-antigen/teichoic acid export membrane protein